MKFDIFHVQLYQQGYTLRVDIARPNNAPRYKHTKADFARRNAANKKNMELTGQIFPTLEELVEEIKRLQFPE
jgi:hypothetical protein